jgi:large subunit ribosomal protein L9
MQVILKQGLDKIGRRGDIVDVSRGYIRNFLVPRNLAEMATPSKLEEVRREMEVGRGARPAHGREGLDIAATLNKSVITIEARTGEDERLFGSVTAANIASAIEKGPRCSYRQAPHQARRSPQIPRYPPGPRPGPR